MTRIGISGLRPPGASWRDTLRIARRAEELGYESITMGESWGEDAFTSLAQIAAGTDRIRIGTSITPIYGRSPANIAMTALNLDMMSEGRFSLGLGASGRAVVEDFHGERFYRPLSRMRECISIIRKAAAGERLDHEGEFFSLSRFHIRFRAHRRNLPIYVASLTPASLRLTGELADGWLPIFLAPSRMQPLLADLAEGARRVGRTVSDIAISPQVSIYVTDDVPAARRRERPHIAFYIGGMGVFYYQYMRRIGFGEAVDHVREAYLNRERDVAAELVTNEMVDAMTIIGNPQQCRDRMQAFFDAGVDEIRLVFNEPDVESYIAAMTAVAPGG